MQVNGIFIKKVFSEMEKQLGRNSPCLLTLVDLLNQKYEFTNITKLAGFAQNLIKVRDGGETLTSDASKAIVRPRTQWVIAERSGGLVTTNNMNAAN
jgi:hypothetical protein